MPVGSRVRVRATVVSVDELDGGWYQVVTRFAVEREGDGMRRRVVGAGRRSCTPGVRRERREDGADQHGLP